MIDYIRRSGARIAAVFTACIFAATALCASGETLSETGGFITTEPQVAFTGVSLADLGTTVFPCAKMGGSWIGEALRGSAAAFCNRTAGTDATGEYVRYEVQIRDGGTAKVVAVKFRQSGDDATVQAVATGYSTNNGAVDVDFTSVLTDGRWDVQLATAADADGYGVFGLKLAQPEDFSSINVNFTYANSSELTTSDAAGAPGFAVPGPYWTQKKGVVATYNTVNILGMVDGAYVQSQLPGSTLAISGTRGTYANGTTYAAATDIRYGYIDENENNTTPTVTISNVPFEFYKVVVYSSTDNTDAQFGYVTVNGVGYCSANASKDDTQAYATTEGTQSWGKSSVAGYLEGVNYLVTPVLKATDARTVAVVGHKVAPARGCIAAIQIVKATAPEIAATAITAADINAAVPSGESLLKIPADATITLDAALTASKVKFVSDGKVTLSAASQPSAEELAKLDFTYVKGAVLRSWLTPGVVGFNFNADGGRENNGTEDSCSDTSLALEIGTWYKNGHNQSGSSTEMFADGLSTLTWASRNVYAEAGDIADGTFIQGYLDDGQNVSITLSAVPYETYDLIIYCSTDNSSAGFKAKTVNGTIYTWNATAGEVTTTSDVNAKWGLASQAAGKAVYGANTLRINGLTGSLSILGGTNSNGARGCISAIQIMPAGTSTAPEMTVGTAGQTTQATWTGANWNVATAPTSGNVIINLSGDVELTIDETVALSAITVNGEGTLKVIPDQANSVTFTASSISSAVPLIFANDGIGIDTISASVTYLYKTPSINSSIYGNTYTAGVGSQESSVAINHNGGSVVLDGTAGEIYWLSQSNNDTSTAVTFTDATVNYSNGLSVGMANYTIGGASVITTTPNSDNNHSFYLSDGQASRTASFILKDTSVVNVSGTSDVDSNRASILFGHWNGPSTFTIQDEAAFNAVAQVLVGKTSNNHTININGGTFTARGIKASASASGTNRLNLNGGLLVLGDVGITSYGSTTIGVNVSANSEIRASAATLPISQSMTLGANTTLSFTKANDVSAATVSLTGAVSGSGDISVGPGITLNLGTNRPEGQITVDEDGVLAIVMADKSDVPVLHVTAQPATVKLYAVGGVTEYADATVEYDAEAGTITIKSPRPVWNANEDSSFETVGNWSIGALPENGQDATVNFAADTDMTVSGDYTLGDLAFTGAGDATVSGSGAITASAYDFSGTTGRVEYNLPTGEAPVTSGSNTLLLGGGSGVPSVASGKKLTLGPWGATQDDGTTFEYTGGQNGIMQPAAGATLVFSPGQGKIQKLGGFGGTSTDTTVAVANGTLVVNKAGAGWSAFFGQNSVRIDDGGILSLEAQDALGYSAPHHLAISEGGVLQVKVRDTLRRTIEFNGGMITVESANSGRALDMFNGNIINVHSNSTIQAIDDGTVSNPLIWFRGSDTIVNIDDGVSFVNNVTYASEDATNGFTLVGTKNLGNGNGAMVMNGFGGNPVTFRGLATIGLPGSPAIYELNCEHVAGKYLVNANSRLRGTGSITGAGGVTLAAANSKFCGSLTVDNLVAANGATYGDQWNPAGNKVAATFEAAGTQTVSYGTFTIGKDVAFKETVTTTTYTNNYALDPNTNEPTDTVESVTTNTVVTVEDREALDRATFNIAATGNLKLERNVAVAGLTVASGGTITLGATRTAGPAKLTVNGTATFTGTLNIVLDYGTGVPTGGKFKILESATLPDVANIHVTDKNGAANWHVTVKDGAIYAENRQGFAIHLF